jgi:hypothetical protein
MPRRFGRFVQVIPKKVKTMGGMSAGTVTGTPAARGSYPMLPMDEVDVLAAELQPRAIGRPAERRLMRTMPGEQPRHFAEVSWLPSVPRPGTIQPIPPSRHPAGEMGDHLSGLVSGSKQAVPQSPPLFSPAGGGGCERALDLCLAAQPMSMSATCWDAYKACVNYPDLWQASV